MKALVTGATGFVGSYLIETLLKHGYQVRALARKTSDVQFIQSLGVEIVYGNLDDPQSLNSAVDSVELVLHAAGKIDLGWGNWAEFERINVDGTRNILEASANAGVKRFLYVSSATVYAPSENEHKPLDESSSHTSICSPSNYYGYSKSLGEQAAFEYQRNGRLDVTIIRPDLIYGPRDLYGTDLIYRHSRVPIVFWPGSDGGLRCPVFAGDVAQFALLAATSDIAKGQAYNVAPPNAIRYRELAERMICAQGGRRLHMRLPTCFWFAAAVLVERWAALWRSKTKPLFTRVDLEVFSQDIWIDGTKAYNELGWQPTVPLEQGLDSCVKWRRSAG